MRLLALTILKIIWNDFCNCSNTFLANDEDYALTDCTPENNFESAGYKEQQGQKDLFRMPFISGFSEHKRNDYYSTVEKKRIFEHHPTTLIKTEIVLLNSSAKVSSLIVSPVHSHANVIFMKQSALTVSSVMLYLSNENAVSPLAFESGNAVLDNISFLHESSCGFVPPLFCVSASADEKLGTFCVLNSKFSSLQLLSTPFLNAVTACSITVSSSSFFNVTSASKTKKSFQKGFCYSFLGNCNFNQTPDAIYGGIVFSVSMPSNSLGLFNCSLKNFHRSSNGNIQHEGNETNLKRMERLSITEKGNHSFLYCKWENINSTSGGAIYCRNLLETSILIMQCNFSFCNSTTSGGGAVFTETICSVKLHNCSFNKCVSTKEGGAVVLYYVLKLPIITGCYFTLCTCNRAGGAIRTSFEPHSITSYSKENGIESQTGIAYCSLIQCSVSEDAGGGLCMSPSGTIEVRNCFFSNCSANERGGSFHWYGINLENKDLVFFYFHLYYESFCKSNVPKGVDVELSDTVNHLRQNPPPFVKSFTTCASQSIYLNYAEGVRYATGWLEPFCMNQFVGNDGQDLIGSVCNDEFSPCRTVQKAISSLHSISLSTITLLEGLISSEPSPLHLDSKTLKITGSSRQNVQLATDLLPADSSLFSISCGTLYVLSFSVDQNSTTVPTPTIFQSDSISLLTISNVAIFSSTFNIEELEVSSHVFDVCLKKVEIRDLLICNITTSESLFHHSSCSEAEDSHLSNITVANVTLLTGSGLILSIRTALNEHLKMMNNTIENCSCISGNGGGIAIFLDHESSLLQIGSQSSSTLFTSCHCGGFGGGIYIEMAEGATDFCLSDITFCKCSANNGGNNVFINGSALSSVWLNNGTLNISFEESSSDDLMCCDRLIPTLNPFSLNAFLVPFNAPAHVTGDPSRGLDSSFCGLSFFPCLTIMHTIRTLFPTSSPLIVIDDCLQVDEQLIVSQRPWNISAMDKGLQVSILAPSDFSSSSFVTVTAGASFYNICFGLPSALQSASFFISCSKSSLLLINCSIVFEVISQGSAVEYGFADIEEGGLEVENFETKNGAVIQSKSFIMCHGLHGFADFKNCRFSGLTNMNGNGGCIYAGWNGGQTGIASELMIDNCNVSECCAEGSATFGGGTYISLGTGDCLVANGSSVFEGCCAGNGTDDGKGLGGGMFLELGNGATNFALEQLRFDQCLAWKGKNIFVNGDHLKEIINEQHFCWNLSCEELSSLEEICGYERLTTGVEYVIPMVVFLWNNLSGNGFVDGKAGADFSGCGYEVSPCMTVDQIFSVQFPPNSLTSPTSITLIQSASINNPISFSAFSDAPSLTTPSVLMEGLSNNTNVFACSVNGADAATICSTVQLSFSDLKFFLPTTSDADTSFVLFSAATSSLSVSRCSFVSNATVSQMAVHPTVLNIVSGGAMLDHVFIVGFSLSGAFLLLGSSVSVASVEFLSAASINVTGASIIGTNSDSKIGSALNHRGNSGRINSKTAITISCSNFSFITREDEGAGIVSGSGLWEMKFIVNKSNLEKCVSEGSKEGGGAMICLEHEYSHLTVEGCSFVWCASSTVEGRGGGMMINCQNKDGISSSGIGEIGLLIKNDVFVVNNAYVGKDIFIQCESIVEQINETLFSLDFNQTALQSNNSICGSDRVVFDVDLMEYIRFFKGEAIFVSEGFEDSRLCGSQTNPCRSISCASSHVEPGFRNSIWINGSAAVVEETALSNLRLGSSLKDDALLNFCESIPFNNESRGIICFSEECVAESCKFLFDIEFACKHPAILEQINGSLLIDSCYFSCQSSVCLNSSLVIVKSGVFVLNEGVIKEIQAMTAPLLIFEGACSAELTNVTFGDLKLANSAIVSSVYSQVMISNAISENTTIANGCFICLSNDGTSTIYTKDALENNKLSDFAKGSQSIFISSFVNITSDGMDGSVVKCESVCDDLQLINCTFSQCFLNTPKGSVVSLNNLKEALIDSCCVFGDLDDEGNKKNEESKRTKIKEENDVCKWNGSVIEIINCSVYVKDSTIANSSKGGVGIERSSVKLEKDEFVSNDGRIEKFRSARRNIVCQGSGELNVVSLKGGDGVLPNTSLWILNEGCSLEGIAGERESPFFIPKVESVSSEKSGEIVDIVFRGSILLPCNLSFEIVAAIGDEEVVEKYSFDTSGFISEEEVHGTVPVKAIEGVPSEAEVRVCVLFGKVDNLSSTKEFVLKNRSAIKQSGDERIVERGKEGKSYWLLIVCIVIVVILFVVIIVLAVRWRKQKRRTRELEEIVNDTVKKDQKAFNMVMMEMSPEEQWRRAERETEKKNEERIKKRIYDTNIEHSESSEHLLSESGSTEYILGKDSDKIPDWALEKDEEEEIRKRTPSPSISSTSTTDTSDTDSTFVRGEDLCPTTSSMSNLVDAMACSSPHEKLIVDLRDSLFMLLHGRNEKKEMAIGSLKEREQTAAQILFWVANLALHSFDEMENPLQSLANLSPHIVLFSEHMVICIVMHSDLLSDDSDSSSISSSTVVTSASDNNEDDDSLPSSAFEDEDYYKKECLRWKAPELLMNKKMGATKESVAFSIGMMLWECLTLQIPFGEYEAEIAGQKIVNGERQNLEVINSSKLFGVIHRCVSHNPSDRPSLVEVKRELIKIFPPEAAMLTMSDAVDMNEPRTQEANESSTKMSFC
ncbi:uncharacterized protein MONOS_3407 [Monocercomonoides exilis]|uniref:uncharacterized protein n=1 Tax=Monocercomonoides exilis TaxID=2049356 RepID=UPI00355A56EE|nr:hypothetical protein MONOS_3407 [Monocercomonoides exilis]|eukprot:MONOS_3407.1-p1 / transcript=MONOS_3407.1 / gene=MONOS_3407 / organism=Monocercomonoides_exilis_PA203 / gene_product=unspecified product / transcript_product=unspecified product / location=Mono_scaffold00080:44588-52687(+) / protein_length=2668 / sequence_SO=supercontig / SO=protein_coding / is_pseudo=false